jgi:hypothetical protein
LLRFPVYRPGNATSAAIQSVLLSYEGL